MMVAQIQTAVLPKIYQIILSQKSQLMYHQPILMLQYALVLLKNVIIFERLSIEINAPQV